MWSFLRAAAPVAAGFALGVLCCIMRFGLLRPSRAPDEWQDDCGPND